MTKLRLLLIVLLLLAPSLSHAAIDCADANATEVHQAPPGTSESISYTTPSGSNQITFLGIGLRNLTLITASNVQIGGQAMTVTPSAWSDTGESLAALYYKVNPPSGTNNVTLDLSADPTSGSYIIWTCSGVDTADPFRSTPVRANGVSNAPTINVTSVNTGDVIVDFFVSDYGTGPPTLGADQTLIHDGNPSGSIAGASWQPGSAGTEMTWTMGGSEDWQIVAAPLKPAVDSDTSGEVLWFP